MSSRRLIWRWNFRMLKGERVQLAIIAGLIALAVATGVAGVLAAYNLAPPPEQTYGQGALRATVIGDPDAQGAAFEERFERVGVVQAAALALPVFGTLGFRRAWPNLASLCWRFVLSR